MLANCLSIAGFDGSGGAGIQADLKTFAALGCYGLSVLTAIPIQNTQGVRDCYPVSVSCVQEQLSAIFDDTPPDCIKIGMLFSVEIVELVADFLTQRAKAIPVVLDPVLAATDGFCLLDPAAITCLKKRLIPLSTVLTPNIPEAQLLIGGNANRDSAQALLALGGSAVLLKGGHAAGEMSEDYFLDSQGRSELLSARRLQSRNTHGTGCTLSAAICAYLAQGKDVLEACRLAKRYVQEVLSRAQSYRIGKGVGPLLHFPVDNVIT